MEPSSGICTIYNPIFARKFKLKTNKISYNYRLDEILDKKLFKICTAMSQWIFKENVSGNKGTQISNMNPPYCECL